MNKLIKQPVELIEPRKWWQFKGKKVLDAEWIVETVEYGGDGTKLFLRDKQSFLDRNRL